MREADFDHFSALLDDVLGLYPSARPATAGQKAMYFRALMAHSVADIRAAFTAHARDPQRGRFAPVPADVIAQLEGAAAEDGRPGPEEAWAIALTGADERATVVWTDEMAQAWGIALPVLNAGDQVGARMAFREAYARLVDAARRLRLPVAWSPSLGHDPATRDEAIEQAVQRGQLARADYPRLAAPSAVPMLALAGAAAPPSAREGLSRLRETIAGAPSHSALQWAFDLRDRELRGDELTPTQRTTWRAAIGATPLPASHGAGFTPPPADTLPPGMRKPRDPEADYFAGAPA